MHPNDSPGTAAAARSFPEILSDIRHSAHHLAFLAHECNDTGAGALDEFADFVSRLGPIVEHLEGNESTHTASVRKAVESLEESLARAADLIRISGWKTPVAEIEDAAHEVGRCLGLVLLAGLEVSGDIRDVVGDLHTLMIDAKFESFYSNGSSYRESEEDSIVEVAEFSPILRGVVEKIGRDMDELVVQLKVGKEEELRAALSELSLLIKEKRILGGWVKDRGIVSILMNRLGSSKHDNRLAILLILRSLASENEENMEKMSDVGALSTVVRSLTRDAEERREAVGLLLTLSEIPRVRQRMGRVQGCVVMLVSMLNGDDACSSSDAENLLNALSGNTQNVLHMAEAGYFKPLVQYLKKGSDMNKILIATTLQKMELTDQSKSILGKEGSIEALVKMFKSGKLEAKLSALGALKNLSTVSTNVQRLIRSGFVSPLLQILFSVTSVFMTLREPASSILVSIAQSETILINEDVAQQMLSLLNLTSPVIQYNLLQALNSIMGHASASKVRLKMKESGAAQLLLPFLTENNAGIRAAALSLLCNLSTDYLAGELTEQLGQTYLSIIVNIIESSTSEEEHVAALGLISNIPPNDKKATEILSKLHLLSILVSSFGVSSATSAAISSKLMESIAGVLIRFTVPSEKKLQRQVAELGMIPWLVKVLSIGSPIAKFRASTSLSQLSQSSLLLSKAKSPRWSCVPPSGDSFCEAHDGHCVLKSTFCIVKAGALSPLIKILEGKEREADEAVLCALATLMQDEIWENGAKAIVNASGVNAVIRILEVGNVKAQGKALWMLERIFRVKEHREQYGEATQALLITLAQNGDPSLKSVVAKILAHLELLQMQSSYF